MASKPELYIAPVDVKAHASTAATPRSTWRLVLFVLAILVVVFNRRIAPSISLALTSGARLVSHHGWAPHRVAADAVEQQIAAMTSAARSPHLKRMPASCHR